ncbi:hypothetical protein EY643_11655 [Halioglobus maricola]|uniref:PEP-CTERM sorting domain-containing protein n=1 Tax=Halioglobus maricola TaxID=2601894 RepID=A0A5P9NK72_9GAMM|nr:hypothetical protein [Halioglobus maricola]QFU76263.1 hypothetical protein EY643_11655 [Halioglobus maricola]
MLKKISVRMGLGLSFWLLLSSAPVHAELVQFEAVFQIDRKTTFDPTDTVIITGGDFDEVQIGDQFTVHFIIDTDQTDSSDVIDMQDNAFLASDARIGNFGSVLHSLAIEAGAGNAGTYDPSGVSISSSTASTTSDAVAVYKSNNAVANKEVIRLLAATAPTPAGLGGDLTDVVINFSNVQPLNASNPEDYLEDRSVTVSPFDFNLFFQGASRVTGNVRDLVLLDDDIVGTGFAVTNLNRPLNLRFGEAEVIPAVGPSYQESIYAWGTLVSLQLPLVPTAIPPLIPGPIPIATPIATPTLTPTAIPTPVPTLPLPFLVLVAGILVSIGVKRLHRR